jgi:SAM-dependent methyltransferase
MLEKDRVKKFWDKRARADRAKAVGLKGQSFEEQTAEHLEKEKFIFQHCPKNYITLDYGCGIGRCSDNFENYLGVDASEEILNIAKEMHPDKNYLLLQEPWLPKELDFDFELFFTTTVLQHNSDEVVREIFRSVANLKKKNFFFSLYENAENSTHHLKARNSRYYIKLLKEHFEILDYKSYEHKAHNVSHILTFVRV